MSIYWDVFKFGYHLGRALKRRKILKTNIKNLEKYYGIRT